MATRLKEIDTSAEALRETLWQSPVIGMVTVSDAGKLIAANSTFLEMLRCGASTDVKGSSLPNELLADAAEWSRWLEAKRCGRVEAELCFRTREGGHAWLRGTIECVGVPGGTAAHLRGIFVDCTASRWLDSVAYDAARTEAASSLAAGVAHDLNNLLTVLVGNLYLASEQLRGDPAVYDKIKRARDAAKRGSDLTRALLNLARGDDHETSTVSPAKLLDGLVPLLSAAVGGRIELECKVDSQVPSIRVNAAQLESAVTNLVINARDALADTEAARVRLEVARRQIEAGRGAVAGLPAAVGVEIAVTDNGPGMADDVAARVFEPFFTTKGKNKGNGLGLPMVRWFAEQSGGTVSIETAPGAGTTCRILLPAILEDSAAESTTMTMPLSTLPGGSETVGVFSEDGDFQSTVDQILGALGYKVVLRSTASRLDATVHECGAAALVLDASVLSAAMLSQVQALVADRTRPIGVVVVGEARAGLDAVVVPKPFSLTELTRAVRDAIPEGR